MSLKFVLAFVCALLTCCLFICGFSQQGENNAPKVNFTTPTKTTKLQWNTIVPYSIHISDKEDGDSGYDEIPKNEVLVLITYISDSTQAKKYILNQSKLNIQPLLQMSTSNCFTCHAARAKLIGPSFLLIAQRYRSQPHAVDSLAKRILRGATGTWGDLKMPPHPDLKIEQLKEIVKWILENNQDPDQDYLTGIEGVFKTKAKPSNSGKGAYILTATYTDHGPKKGQQSVGTIQPGSRTTQQSIVLKNIE